MILLILIATIIVAGFLIYFFNPRLGSILRYEDQIKYASSSNFDGERFINPVPTTMAAPKWETMKEFFKKGTNRKPDEPIASAQFKAKDFSNSENPSEIKFSWFGHSSVLIQIEGKNLLIDPVFSKRASMFSWIGPKEFNYAFRMSANQLPQIDAVLISHDHYDHLDYYAITELKEKVRQFYVPLGVEVHLKKWGISEDKITVLDWWDEAKFNENLKFILTPSRHFSGRGLTNRNTTLWGGWAIMGTHKKVFFSGDSGYFDGFKKIGEKFGLFDLAFIECGQYNIDWESIHMLPEQSAQAAEDANAKMVVPIHWGKFKLSIHPWIEPVERFLKASEKKSFQTLIPKPNEIITLAEQAEMNYWWRE